MNQLTTTQNKPVFSLAPQSLEQAMQFADMLSRSNLVPKDYQGNPANCIIAMQWGMEIGLQPLQAMQNIAVINGRPAIWGDAMLALVRGSGLLEFIDEDPQDTGCTVRIKRKGEPEAVRSFTLEDAKKAGLLGKQGPWQQHTRRMMQLRARAFALRDVFPDVLRGVHIAEEARDMPPETKDMGTADEVKPAARALPASRADKARAALAQRKAAAAVTIEAALDAIHHAETPEALKAAGQLAAQLDNDDDKATARDAYATRKAQLLTTPKVDADTGELLQPAFPTMQPEPAVAADPMAEHADFLADMA